MSRPNARPSTNLPRRHAEQAVGPDEGRQTKGALLASGGLLSFTPGARLRANVGKVTILDGPFAEAKELIAGYSIVEANSLDEAVELARRSVEI